MPNDTFAVARSLIDRGSSVEPFRGLFDRSSEAVVMFDDGGSIVDCNPAALTFFDVDWNAMVTRDVRSFVAASPWMPDPDATWQVFLATGEWSGPIRVVLDDGTTRDADLRALAEFTPGRHMAVLRDETERRATEAALAASEERLRLIAERSHDVVFKFRVEPDRSFEYVSPSLLAVTGYTPAEFYADPTIAFDMIHPDDRAEFQARTDDGRLFVEPVTLRWVRKDGSILWVEQTNIQTLDAAGLRTAIEGVARDVTARVEAARHLAACEARFRSALEGISLHAVLLDLEGRILFMNRYAASRLGICPESVIGRPIFDVVLAHADRPAAREAFRYAMTTGDLSERWENEWTTATGERIRIDWSSSCTRDATGRVVGLASVGEDVTARRDAEATQARLVAAIEQAAESILVTDAEGVIVFANPAFVDDSGFKAADVIGRHLIDLLAGGRRSPQARRIARRFKAGFRWVGELEITRGDGSTYREETIISPVRDNDGALTSFVAVARDVSQIRAMQEAMDMATRERAIVAQALARLEVHDTPEATAQVICDVMTELPGVDLATVSWFHGDDIELVALASGAPFPVGVGERLPGARASYLREKARQGPWSEAWAVRDVDGTYGTVMAESGVLALAYAPIGNGSGMLGLVVVGTNDAAVAERFTDHIPAVIEFAAAARTLLAGAMETRLQLRRTRTRIADIVDRRTFHSVFQPIVDMVDGRPIGFEALTRFDSGQRPDLVFADAASAGLGHDLEEVTLTSAIEASWALPAGPWLSLNVSAAFLLDGQRLAQVLRRRTRPIILEITEHVAIEDYEAVRMAIAALGPDVRIAVDDAGAGVANFTHIVNLRPDFVKIDASLIRDVNADLTRQALIVGLLHFARATNCWIIAEGVETAAERVTLGDLDIAFGQGYLFGKPRPVAAWEAPAAPIHLPGGLAGDGRGSKPKPTVTAICPISA